MPKGLRITLRVLVAVMACLLFVLSSIMFMAKLCFLNEDRYVSSVLDDDFYDSVLKSRRDNLSALGTMIELDDEALNKYASEEVCLELSEKYVRGVFSDMLGHSDREVVSFSSDELLVYIKEDFKGYDFSDTPYKTSDVAAEKAYNMVCAEINDAVLFIPESVTKEINKASGAFNVLDSIASLWFLPLLLGLGLLAVVVFVRQSSDLWNNLFGASVSFWAASVLIFAPVVILFWGTGSDTLELDKDTLYHFIDGCISAVRGAAFTFATVYFCLASALLAAAGIKATARRKTSGNAPVIAEDGEEGAFTR